MNISESDVKALVEQGDVIKFIAGGMRDGAQANAHRRGLVLAHPDLAKELTGPPADFARPEQWTGYIPPALTGTGAINSSPVRPFLLKLVAEAEKRGAQPLRAAA